ncbi:HNH endonuclease [Mycobacteroides abscessus]|uniref:HNH endonuclease n=1 Tax=Mycobacteroides abscessus TaxID=36809 RepID=UPI003742164A
MSGYKSPTDGLAEVFICRNLAAPDSAIQQLPSKTRQTVPGAEKDHGRRLAAFAAGAALVLVSVAGMHNLYRAGGQVGDWLVWVGALLLWLSALGGGVKLATWGAKPLIDAAFEAGKARVSESVQAVTASGAVIAGALGLWWALRGEYAQWWQNLSGESGWSLALGAGQMLAAVLAGAALFTGGKYLAGLTGQVLADAGLMRTESPAAHRDPTTADKNAQSHPALVVALVAGGIALIIMAAWLTPKLAPTITGANTFAAAAAIAAVLVWGVGANLGWWKGLEGLYAWATAASEKTAAVASVVAVLMFSASGLGLGWFTPATVPQAHAQCPPDCGGGSNGSNSYGPDASQFQPPQMPNQMPDYQGGNYGSNQAPLDQNSGISIYNTQAPSISNNGSQGSSGQQGPQQSWDQPAHGTQIPDYQTATPYTQGPGRPNPDYHPNTGTNPGSQGGQANQGAPQQQAPQQPPANQSQPAQQQPGQQSPANQDQQPPQQSDQQRIDDLTKQLQDQQQQSTQDRQRIDDMTKQLQNQQGQQKQNGNQKLPKAPSKDKKKDDQQDRDEQSGDNDTSALLLGAASTRRRKQDDQQQPQGPDTQALTQDGAQLGQSLPGDIANTVSDGVNLGQSAGSAAQNFGSAAQAGASIASSAQSGAVNPMDAVALVQGISGGISDTADAVGSGASIASTWLNEAGQGAQLAADANPQLKPQAQEIQQLTQAGSQVADLTGQVASGVSQVSGVVNTVSSLGASGMPDTSGATDALSGTATAVNGPADVPKPPTPPSAPQSSSSVQALDSTTPRAPQQPPQPTIPASTSTANQTSTPTPLSPLAASAFPAPLQALNSANAGATPNPNVGGISSLPGVRDVSSQVQPQRLAPTLQPDQVDAFKAVTRQNLINQHVPADQIDQRVNDAVAQAQTPRFMPDAEQMRTPGAQPLDRPLGDKFNDVMGRANDRAYERIDGMSQMGQLAQNLTGLGGPGAPGVADSWKDLGINTAKGLPGVINPLQNLPSDAQRAYEKPGEFLGDKAVDIPLAAATLPAGGEGAAIERGALGDLASTETRTLPKAAEPEAGPASGGSTYKQRLDKTPINNGQWTDQRGESTWLSQNPAVNQFLHEAGVDGIEYSNARPDFGPVAQGQVEIPNMTTSRPKNFNAADEKLAQIWGVTPKDVAKWRSDNKYTWHEEPNLTTMQLVPSVVNGRLGHIGGVGEIKAGKTLPSTGGGS